MCVNTCIAYTGPLSLLECHPHCLEPHYHPIVLRKSGRKKKKVQRVFHTLPIGLQLQALYHSRESAQRVKYAEEKLQEIVDQCKENWTMQYFKDWCHCADFVKAFQDGHIKKGDPVLMFLINGMQLFCNKSSDCWVYIWIIFNLDPKTGCYKKVSVLFGGIIPGPKKPKNLEFFLFLGLHHLSAIQNVGCIYGSSVYIKPIPCGCFYWQPSDGLY